MRRHKLPCAWRRRRRQSRRIDPVTPCLHHSAEKKIRKKIGKKKIRRRQSRRIDPVTPCLHPPKTVHHSAEKKNKELSNVSALVHRPKDRRLLNFCVENANVLPCK